MDNFQEYKMVVAITLANSVHRSLKNVVNKIKGFGWGIWLHTEK